MQKAVELHNVTGAFFPGAMSDERSAKRPKIEEESVDANEAIAFVLQSRERNQIFKPEMCHQLFGDDESISGHVDPSATVLIDHSSFNYAITFESKQKSSSATKVWLAPSYHLCYPQHMTYLSLCT